MGCMGTKPLFKSIKYRRIRPQGDESEKWPIFACRPNGLRFGNFLGSFCEVCKSYSSVIKVSLYYFNERRFVATNAVVPGGTGTNSPDLSGRMLRQYATSAVSSIQTSKDDVIHFFR